MEMQRVNSHSGLPVYKMISGVESVHSWAAALLITIRVVTELGQLLGADLSPKLASFMKSECSSLRSIGAHP